MVTDFTHAKLQELSQTHFQFLNKPSFAEMAPAIKEVFGATHAAEWNKKRFFALHVGKKDWDKPLAVCSIDAEENFGFIYAQAGVDQDAMEQKIHELYRALKEQSPQKRIDGERILDSIPSTPQRQP